MKRWWVLIAAVTLALIALEMGAHDAEHATLWWHATPGFDLVYGFAGCVAIIVVSKALGKWWLQRSEIYYDEDGS